MLFQKFQCILQAADNGQTVLLGRLPCTAEQDGTDAHGAAQKRRVLDQGFYLWYLLPALIASARYTCSSTMTLAR